MTPGELAALEDRVCLAFEKLSPGNAHTAVAKPPGGRTAYRCPFGHGHWHAEELALDTLERMAEVIRERRDPACTHKLSALDSRA